MSECINKTSIYSIIFLDIIDYSKKAVSLQIEQKEAFNKITTQALDGIALADRIILDTGDGLAIGLLGEPQEALFVSLTIRDNIIQYDNLRKTGLQIRIGINLGPVRVVKDINGRPNIIGDGINVAERVMSFAKPNQILVSRTYYEVTSRLTDEINQMFSYFGMKQDKHVREHEIYEISAEAKTGRHITESSGAKPNMTINMAWQASSAWFNQSKLHNTTLWLDKWVSNKLYLLGILLLLLFTLAVLNMPSSAPVITIDSNIEQINTPYANDEQSIVNSSVIDKSLDLSNVQATLPAIDTDKKDGDLKGTKTSINSLTSTKDSKRTNNKKSDIANADAPTNNLPASPSQPNVTKQMSNKQEKSDK